jgi:hypothetical protein
MTTIWAELPGHRADSADDGSPTLEHIIFRGESPHSLDFFLYMDHVGPKGHMVT